MPIIQPGYSESIQAPLTEKRWNNWRSTHECQRRSEDTHAKNKLGVVMNEGR